MIQSGTPWNVKLIAKVDRNKYFFWIKILIAKTNKTLLTNINNFARKFLQSAVSQNKAQNYAFFVKRLKKVSSHDGLKLITLSCLCDLIPISFSLKPSTCAVYVRDIEQVYAVIIRGGEIVLFDWNRKHRESTLKVVSINNSNFA